MLYAVVAQIAKFVTNGISLLLKAEEIMASFLATSQTNGQADVVSASAQIDNLHSFPCVLYECNSLLEISYVSRNISELINLSDVNVIGSRAFSHDRVFRDDMVIVDSRLKNLDSDHRAFLVHRIIDDSGVSRWVAHSLWKNPNDALGLWRGCIVPIPSESRVLDLNHAVVSRFIHKIGNHFQLLMLLTSPLKASSQIQRN